MMLWHLKRWLAWLRGGEKLSDAMRRWRRQASTRWRRRTWRRRAWRRRLSFHLLLLTAGFAALVILAPQRQFGQDTNRRAALPPDGATQFSCLSPYVVDGDTIHCSGRSVRLAGIDAPEMPGHCRPGRDCTPGDPFASREHLRRLIVGQVICRRTDQDVYGRTVARCESGGRDLSCAMVASGHAVRRYGPLFCLS